MIAFRQAPAGRIGQQRMKPVIGCRITQQRLQHSMHMGRGAQIFANGTVDAPIIFTSDNDRATWTGGNPQTGTYRQTANTGPASAGLSRPATDCRQPAWRRQSPTRRTADTSSLSQSGLTGSRSAWPA